MSKQEISLHELQPLVTIFPLPGGQEPVKKIHRTQRFACHRARMGTAVCGLAQDDTLSPPRLEPSITS